MEFKANFGTIGLPGVFRRGCDDVVFRRGIRNARGNKQINNGDILWRQPKQGKINKKLISFQDCLYKIS